MTGEPFERNKLQPRGIVRGRRLCAPATVVLSSLASACGTGPTDALSDASVRESGAGGSALGDAASGVDGAAQDDASPSGEDAGPATDRDADAGAGAGTDARAGAGTDAGPAATRVYGVTIDDITDVPAIVSALGGLPHKPTTRIVFDEGQQPAYYAKAVPAVHAVSSVMGEILDSAFVKNISTADYGTRTSAYLSAFPATVDLWEVGNEINGSWLETPQGGATEVAAKMTAAFDLVHAAGGRAALTLYGCTDDPAHDMFQWTRAHVPARMLSGLDDVLVSYYEGDCAAPMPDWPAVFHQLRQLFPSAGLGFGEIGAVDANGQDVNDASVAGPYLQRYYGMKVTEPGYVGGYFWWYFYEDMVPMTKPLFTVLSDAIR